MAKVEGACAMRRLSAGNLVNQIEYSYLNAVPILSGKRILGFLLEALLSLRKSLVLSYGHPGLYRSTARKNIQLAVRK
jgi:hypothetical protein